MPNVVVAHNTFAGVAKESTFGVAVPPTLFPGFSALQLAGKNTPIAIPNGRQRRGNAFSPAGKFDVSGNFDPSPDPGTFPAMLAWAMGAQTAPAFASWATSLTTGATTSGSNTVFPVTAGTGTSFPVGQLLQIDSGTNFESATISANSANSVTVASTTKNHASGVIVYLNSATAYASLLTYGASLPSFTTQWNRGADAIDFPGCTIDTFKLSGKPGGLLMPSFGVVAQTIAVNGSPASASYSTILPYNIDATPPTANTQINATVYNTTGVQVNGAALNSGTILRSWDLSMNNNLEKDYRGVGSRLVAGFPLGKRTGQLKMTFSFTDNALWKLFLGSATATGPNSTIGGVSASITVASQSLADATRSIPYSLTIITPNLFPTDDPVPGKDYGSLEQTFSADLAETPGLNDDLKIVLVGTGSSAY